MKPLTELAPLYHTDKHTTHSYMPIYDLLFPPEFRARATGVLEIGVSKGWSVAMWLTAFPFAVVTGMDVKPPPRLLTHESRYTHFEGDAYTNETMGAMRDGVKMVGGLDVVIDDGPHDGDSQVFAARNYSRLVREGGVFVIEDVPSVDRAYRITEALPVELRTRAMIIDRRFVKGRYDDMMVVVKV